MGKICLNHRCHPIIRPFRHVMEIAVFWKTSRVYLTEKGIFRKIRGRFTDVIPTAPDKLAETVLSVAVSTNYGNWITIAML